MHEVVALAQRKVARLFGLRTETRVIKQPLASIRRQELRQELHDLMRISAHDLVQVPAFLGSAAIGAADAIVVGTVRDVLVESRFDLLLLQKKREVFGRDLDRRAREKQNAAGFELLDGAAQFRCV